MNTACRSCELVARRDVGDAPLWDSIHRTRYWDVVHCYGTSLPGWIVLVARRHMTALDELTEEEAVELGSLLRRVSIGLKEITGCLKTYVIQFAEAADHPHVHFHVIPRMKDQPPERKSMGIFGYLGVPEEQCVPANIMNIIALQLRHYLEA